MSNNSTERRAKEAKLRELRQAMTQLESELEQELERNQHDAIDKLEVCMKSVDSKFENLRMLWEALKEELKKAFKNPQDEAKK